MEVPNRPASEAVILPFGRAGSDPKPIAVLAAHRQDGSGNWTTSIARRWADGDPGRCRLCAECTACEDVCLLVVPGRYDADEAEFYRSPGLARSQA